MKLSIFTTASNSIKRGDLYNEAIECYTELADEVIIVDGSFPKHLDGKFTEDGDKNHPDFLFYNWPHDFDWPFIGQQFQRGYEAATGDWVIHADLDFIFHEDDFKAIRTAIEANNDAPALSFYKWQFILPDRYNLKSRLVLAVNKGKFGDRIRFDSGGDLCQPSLDGKEIKPDSVPESRIRFFNYEKMTKSFPQILDDVYRMDKAFKSHFGQWLYSDDGSQLSAFYGWLDMMKGRFAKPSEKIPLDKHPKFVQETVKGLEPGQFGYDGLGHLERNSYILC